MQLYRFSPINDEQTCQLALKYINKKLKALSSMVLGENLSINTLKIFAHYEDEYELMKGWLDSIGKGNNTSSPSYYVKTASPIKVNDSLIDYIGIRKPDPYRYQVGCGDFVVQDYQKFKEKFLGKTPFMREVDHPKFEMLELFHPDFDVLGYIVKD